MIEYLRTTGKRLLSLKKDKSDSKIVLHVGTCTSPPCHRYQGVPNPEGRGIGETQSPYSPDLKPVPVPEVEAPGGHEDVHSPFSGR
ncbi:Hypothetical protein FKW44_004791 [Caligus rogercresseyi]|uniref:Uncharacterized protein n=1 Tax=Caligus rogercresseyi TaxID=217165 RepID=A0A7T8HMD1_CALRO|nr:Hypothetical protein FKW44_004791 [Caligus rogercresseyi]